MRHLLCKYKFGIRRGCGADNSKHGVYKRELYINVPEKDVLAIIEMYINVPGQDVLAIIVIRENCT